MAPPLQFAGGTIAAGVYGLLTHQDLQPKGPEHPERVKPPVVAEQPLIPNVPIE